MAPLDHSGTTAWLPLFLADQTGAAIADDQIPALRLNLITASFTDLVGALESASPSPSPMVAIQIYQHWIAGQAPNAPFLFAAWFNLGVSFARAGDRTRAAAAYQAALGLRPDFHAAATNLGLIHESLGNVDAALALWAGALQPDEARTTLLNHRARLFEQLNRLEEAEQELRRSLLTNPEQPDAIQHFIYIRQKLCAWPVLTPEIPGLTEERQLRHAGPLSLLALCDDVAVQCDTAAGWIARKAPPPAARLSPEDGYGHDRVRLGYLSSDFCRHAMSYLIAELFERHDRARFEVFGYDIGRDDGSAVRARLLGAFDLFRPLQTLDDEAAARAIQADEIDILIDLNGLTSGARPGILRWKPAPVQATYLGFVGPVPIPELDYLFCDPLVVPPGMAAAYRPKPLYIAPLYQANDSKRAIGQAGTRAAAGLRDGAFVFCCFSNYYKITEDMFVAWMTILRRSENSVLWMAADNAVAQANLRARAIACGVTPERLIFANRVGPDDYMARLTLADLFLDTFPYNAGTIASDAIRMGLPLVTRVGWSFASRMAGRLLTAVGATDGIATDLESYIEIAVRLASDRQAHDEYKRLFGLPAWQREIGDIAGFAASYEDTLMSIAKRPFDAMRAEAA